MSSFDRLVDCHFAMLLMYSVLCIKVSVTQNSDAVLTSNDKMAVNNDSVLINFFYLIDS